MKTMNLLEFYPGQDIQRKISLPVVIISVILFVAGSGIFFFSLHQPETNLNTLIVFVGCALIGISLYYLGFKMRYWAYVATGSAVYRDNLSFEKRNVAQWKHFLSDYANLSDVYIDNEKESLSLALLLSKDKQYVAFQLLAYSSFLYKPVSDVFYLREESAAKFIDSLKDMQEYCKNR